ncbi:hypothetical protein HMPREF0658_1297 [Hoylesella marshii DSM 16973 = JCM 13450]|uniref:Uncharacterized protein n=1 Tax=Hoylesella marshii DSM 16973 = JCM 13450 TaxID=862515 RepID=E0NSU5_9BACT|nr:hypothetical protein HMPREF0658_1297 [Hoylesella marshii DSM 16973 = JCM 13450]
MGGIYPFYFFLFKTQTIDFQQGKVLTYVNSARYYYTLRTFYIILW